MLTIHRSKGLEFPIVYCPYLWEPSYIPTGRAGRLPRPRRGRPAHDRRRARRRRTSTRHKRAAPRRAARRGPAARLRRADPRAPPGRRLVGGLVRQPRLGARPAAVRARGRTGPCRPTGRGTPTDAAAIARFEALARGGAGLHQRRARRSSGCRRRWSGPLRAPADADGRALRPRARPALAPDLVQRHHRAARTRRAWRASPRRRVLDRRAGGAGRARRRRRRRGAARDRRRCSARCRPACASARSCTACSRRPTSPRPTSTPSWPARVAEAQARRPVELGDAGAVVAGPARGDRDAARPLDGAAAARRRARRPARRARLRAPARRRRRRRPAGSRSDAIAAVLREHLPAGDPLAGYADRLDDPSLRRSVRGYLTGSIDLVRARRRAASRSSTTRRTGSPRRARS